MRHCAALAGDAHEPYRAILREIRKLLRNTIASIEQQLVGEPAGEAEVLQSEQQLWQPLLACHQSLTECGMEIIAGGSLLDVLRRIRCFGVHLVRHDIRQDSARHTEAMSGDYPMPGSG